MKGAGNLQLTVSCRPHCRTHTMKLKKNLAAAALAVAMVASLATPVFAIDGSDTDTPTTGTTNVKYDVSVSYEWSIPSEIDFTNAANSTVTTSGSSGNTQNVLVTKNVIPVGQSLVIKVSSDQYESNSYYIKATKGASTQKLNYSIKKSADGEALENNAEVLKVESGKDKDSQPLVFTLTKASGNNISEKAGNYTDTLTFTASIE